MSNVPRPWTVTLVAATYLVVGAVGFVGAVCAVFIAVSNDSTFNVVVGLIFATLGLLAFGVIFASGYTFARRGMPQIINSAAAIFMLFATPITVGLAVRIGTYDWPMAALGGGLLVLGLGMPALVRLPVNRAWLAQKAEEHAARQIEANRRFAQTRFAAATRWLTGEPLPTDPPEVRAAWLAERARRDGERS